MRLSGLKGFELRLPPDTPQQSDGEPCPPTGNLSDHKEPPRTYYRLVAYTAEQAAPVYVSEKLVFSSQEPVLTNDVSFRDSRFGRSFMLAVQLRSDTSIVQEWVLDLRLAKASKNVKTPHSLLLLTDHGLMAVPRNEEGTQGGLQPPAEISRFPSTSPSSPNPMTNHDGPNQSSVEAVAGLNTPNTSRSTRFSTPSFYGDVPSSTPDRSPPPNSTSLIARWLPAWVQVSPADSSSGASKTKPLTSLSYSMLVDLWTLQKILDEARAASQDLCHQIDQFLPNSALPLQEKVSQLDARIRKIHRKLATVNGEAEELKSLTEKVISNSETKRMLLDKSMQTEGGLKEVENETENRKLTLATEHSQLPGAIKREQARLASQLMEIFPIEPLTDGKFHFAIRGLILPPVFAINHFDTTQIAAALGFVAQIVVCLSRYLDIPLSYPITVCGSQSFITDNISLIKHGSTKFPLWTRGALLYRVEYALYLLHKDIDQLMSCLGLAVADLKQTLANLKNLLLVVSSYDKM